MKHFLLAIAGAFLAFQAQAKVEIQDPQSLISQLEAKLGAPSFESLFLAKDEAVFDRYVESCEISCTEPTPGTITGCGQICKGQERTITRKISELTADQAVVTGDDGYYEVFPAAEVRECRANLAVRFLQKIDELMNVPGKLKLTKLSTFQLPLANGSKAEAYSLWGQFNIDGSVHTFEVKVSVVPTAPGVGQVAMFSTMGGVWFRLKGFQR